MSYQVEANRGRREHKRKAAEQAIDSVSRIETDFPNWRESTTEFIRRLSSDREEVRLSGLRSLCNLLCIEWRGSEFSEYLPELVDRLRDFFTESSSFDEYESAVFLACCCGFTDPTNFEGFATDIVAEQLQLLPSTTEDTRLRFFLIAFLISINVTDHRLILDAASTYISIIGSKRTRNGEFTPKIISEAINGLGLIISSLPPEVVQENFLQSLNEIFPVITRSFNKKVLEATATLIVTVHSILLDVDEGEAHSFCYANRPRLQNLNKNVKKKATASEVELISRKMIEHLEGEPLAETIILKDQEILVSGAHQITILAGLRRITRHYFQTVFSSNEFLHEMFGFALRSQHYAQRMKKMNKEKNTVARDSNRRERERTIAKKRKNKASQQILEDDE